MARLGALMAAFALAATACSGSDASPQQLTVFAAASLGDAFRAMARPFADTHDGYSVAFSFAGSQQLVAQLQQGAKADAVATADVQTMDRVPKAHATAPFVFAGNRLVIAVGRDNPKHVQVLADLARPGLRVVLAAPAVPSGNYARDALAKANVSVTPASLEENVEGVVTKVALGEADAGIVYATDATPARNVDDVAIPEDVNVRAQYPATALTQGGRQFVAFLRSTRAQAILRRFGFLPSSP